MGAGTGTTKGVFGNARAAGDREGLWARRLFFSSIFEAGFAVMSGEAEDDAGGSSRALMLTGDTIHPHTSRSFSLRSKSSLGKIKQVATTAVCVCERDIRAAVTSVCRKPDERSRRIPGNPAVCRAI